MEEVRPLFEKIEESVSTLQGKVGDLEGVIKIGATLDTMHENFYESIKTFKIKFPNVRFELTFDIDSAIEDKMLSNELDIGVLYVYRDQRVLVGEPLETRKSALCCRKDFYETHGPFKKYSDLLGVPFAEYTHHFGSFGRWMKLNCPSKAKLFMQQLPEIVVYSTRTLESFVTGGICMGFLDATNPKRLKNHKQLIELFPKSERVCIDLNYVTKKKETERLIEKEFKAHLFSTWDREA